MVKILRNCDPMADCKPVVFMSCFLLIFWLLLSYVTNSYFAIFLMVSNFILIFGCCVSLSGYVVGQLIDTRRETGQLIEVATISAPQPFVRPPEYPPSYDEAIRFGWQQCMNQNGGDGVVLCIPLENDPRMNPIYMNLPYGTPVETSHLSVPYNGLSSIPSYEMSVSSAANGSTLPLNVSSRSNVINDVIPSIPSYEMSTSSATLGSSLPLNMTSRSNLISDVIPTYELSISPVNNGSTSPSSVISRSSAADNIESSSSIMKPSPTIQNLTPLPDSTVKNSNPENSIAVARANSTSRTFTPHSRLSSESDLNLENASNLDSPKISRFHVLSESPVSSTSSAHASVPELEQFNRSVSEVQNEQDPDVCVNLPTSSQDFTTRRLSYSLSSGHSSSLSRSLSFPGIR